MALSARLRGGFEAQVIPNGAPPGDAPRVATKAMSPCKTKDMDTTDDRAIGGRYLRH
jgi:hypothetical protein